MSCYLIVCAVLFLNVQGSLADLENYLEVYYPPDKGLEDYKFQSADPGFGLKSSKMAQHLAANNALLGKLLLSSFLGYEPRPKILQARYQNLGNSLLENERNVIRQRPDRDGRIRILRSMPN